MIDKLKNKNKGAVALILVIMITALTVVSVAIVAMTNISDLMSSYSFGEAEGVDIELDACLEDAMFRLASSTDASGIYYLSGVGIDCYYEIDGKINSGLKIVTSTASSTTDNIGYWQDTVVAQINVSSTPISIDSYKNSSISFDTYLYCGDGTCNNDETCSDCETDCGSCQVCGNGSTEGTEACDDGNTDTEVCGDGTTDSGGPYCNADCTAEHYVGGEVCDDGDTVTEGCGNGVVESGSGFCNYNCTTEYSLSEGCDYYTLSPCLLAGSPSTNNTCGGKAPLCPLDCSACTALCGL
ncbi:MAG: hypothetical protein HOE19_02430 [Candidatus Komeilibacteria bacterium]|jgi:hypothetical protein|nr:hypothetical protein [Candidatus Komeilibacteria bacterium]MBT4447581.1 hypothetical protein [Candidatus Komeilibacteria bacterium]